MNGLSSRFYILGYRKIFAAKINSAITPCRSCRIQPLNLLHTYSVRNKIVMEICIVIIRSTI